LDPFESGMLPVEHGAQLYWECSGSPAGVPVLYLHGGPGGGLRTGGYRRWCDPERYLVVGLDQRGCGRSRPLVTEDLAGLAVNTTGQLIEDIELLRAHLRIERWLVMGGSWGTTLALAYAQAHPDRVSHILLSAVGLTDAIAVEWITETVGRLFPREWDRFRAFASPAPGQSVVEAYYAMLTGPDQSRRYAAAREWMRWEHAHVSLDPRPRGAGRTDPDEQLLFATLVTHYWSHAAFLPDGALLEGMSRIADIPGVLVHGRLDVSSPADVPYMLHTRWPASRFVLIDDEGHGGPRMSEARVSAIENWADIP
jgi:proline iminopeptidase